MLVRILLCLAALVVASPATAGAQSIVDDNPAVTSPTPGKLVVAVRAGDGTVVLRELDTASGRWSGWTAVRGQRTTSGPALTHDDDGTLRLFTRGEDGSSLVANSGRLGAGWSGWTRPIDIRMANGPGATNRRGSSALDVAVVGTNGAVFHASQKAPTSPFDPLREVPGASATFAPGIVSTRAEHLSIYTRNPNSRVTDTWRPNPGGDWGSTDLGGDAASAVAAISQKDPGVDIFVRDIFGAIQTRSNDGGWGPWQKILSDPGVSAPAAAITGGGRVDLVTRDANTLYHTYSTPGAGWRPATPVGPIEVPADRGALNGQGATENARLTLGLSGAKRKRAGGGKRRSVYRLGQRVRVNGRLLAEGGGPIAGARVILTRRNLAAGAQSRPLATVTTDQNGRFSHSYKAGPGRAISARYMTYANDANPAARAVVEARTKARITLRLARRGQTVIFRGSLRGGAIPKGGKTLMIQAYQRGRWRAYARDARTDRKGRYRATYRFDQPISRAGVVRFRAVVRREGAYPFLGGVSKVRTLRTG